MNQPKLPTASRLATAALLAATLHLGFGIPSSSAAETPRPNIVYILCDDLGYGDVRCLNPEGKIPTPNMDRLGAAGMIFTDAHSSSAVCTPTRYGVLTGRYNWRSRMKQGVLNGFSPRLIEPNRMTVAAFLKQQGYATACIGKWHLGMNWPQTDGGAPGASDNPRKIDYSRPIEGGPTALGFDSFFGISASLDMFPYTFIENDRVAAVPTVEKTWIRKGPAAPDFEAIDVLPALTKKAADFINQRAAAAKQGQPFFLYLPLASPHTPILPTKAWQGKSGLSPYADFVMQTDATVGAVLDALDRQGLTDNTLVVFTSDNGCSPAAGFPELLAKGHNPSARLRGTKADIFDGGHRIPFLVRWPARVKPGGTSDQLICLTDMFATCAAILGQKLPDNVAEDSVSILPALTGQAREPLREAVVHHSINGSFAIRQGPWKLELCADSGGWSDPKPGTPAAAQLPAVQLYNLANDLGETRNVQAEHPEIVADLTRLLEKYVAEGRSTPGQPQANTGEVEIKRIRAGAKKKQANAGAKMQLFVSAGAAPGGNGSQRAPFQSLTQARDAIRAARKAGTLATGTGVTVMVGEGVYNLTDSFQLTAEDSGTAGAEVVYRSRQRGQAGLRGGITLEPASFKGVTDAAVLARLDQAARGKVLACDLAARFPGTVEPFKTAYHGAPAGPWLYLNGQPMTLARWPNIDAAAAGWAGFTKAVDTGLPEADATDPARRKLRPGAFEFADPRPARWNLREGVWLLGYWTHDWSDEVIRVGSYDKERKIITMAAPHNYGIMGGTWGSAQRRFFALNALEELDAPGEWYLDRTRKILYFYPPEPLGGASVVLATLTQPLVRMDGANHVKLVNLEFGYGHGDGLVIQNAKHVEIAGCEVANCAGGGISVNGSNNTVRSCDVFNLGKEGISLNGGDRKTLALAGNLAVNNHIHHYGIFQRTYAPGIGVGGCGQIVRHNRIHDAPHNAVLYGGNEHLFENNEIYRVVMETGDAGAFYTGRDWTSQGNVLRHNYIHDLGGGDSGLENTMGVYLDDCDCGDTIEGNIFYRAGRAIMIGGGRDNPVLNNLVIDCAIGLHIDARGMTWKQWNNPGDPSWSLEEKAKRLDYTQPPWSVKYPRLAAIMNEEPRQPRDNPIRRNVFVDCTKKVHDFDGNVMKLIDQSEMADNLIVNTRGAPAKTAAAEDLKGWTRLEGTPEKPVELGFTDLAQHDFTLRENARLLKELPAFVPIQARDIGLYQDTFRRKLPPR